MAESVDALVSNTCGRKAVPVRPRLWVPKSPDVKASGFCVLCIQTWRIYRLANLKTFVNSNLLYKFDIVLSTMGIEKNKQSFDNAELELLREGLKRSYKERFEMATRLFKIQQTMNKALISHKPFISK